MSYQGPIVDQDDRFQYQQVAPNTLIAHDAGKDLEVSDRVPGLAQERGREDMEIGYGR
ncbi:KfrB domain-containing protein [Thiolapillus sp.]